MIITSYNIFQKVTFQETDISNQYQRAYNADKYYLESNNQTIKKDDYEKVIERINLEKYAIDNNIKYNILLNSQNKNAIIPQDARILLMKVFDNFEILIIFLIIYLSCTTISEEYYTGTIKNVFKEPIKDAVVKLIEIDFGKDGRKKRIPVSHTFTDEYGEFVFGPLCPGKKYAIDIWVNDVRHYNMEFKGHHEGKCLKGRPGEKCECEIDEKPCRG